MDYDGISSAVRDAEESDWLDVSYSQRKYVDTEQAAPVARSKNGWGRPIKIALVAAVCVALLAAMLLIDGNFGKEVFLTAKAAYSSALNLFEDKQQSVSASITLPANVNLVNVQDGIATFDGGRAALSFTDGTVVAATDTSVTVDMDGQTRVTYGNLTTVYAAVGDKLSANELIGKYDGTFTATLSVDGETVVDVVGSEQQLTWTV